MKKNFLILIFDLFAIMSFSQITFTNSQIAVGDIIANDYPYVAFEYINLSAQRKSIIRIENSSNLDVKYEKKFINQGEKSYVYVKYLQGRLGAFSENINVYISDSAEPIVLNYSGNNVAVNQCFPNMRNLSIRKILVVDAITKAPISSAQIVFENFNGSIIKSITDKKGECYPEIPIGMYEISLSENSHKSFSVEKHISKSMPFLLFEMQSKEIQTNRTENIVAVDKQNEIPQLDENGLLSSDLYKPNNVVFLIDISLSMKKNGKMEQLKLSMCKLVDVIRDIDKVSLITYNSKAYVNVEAMSGSQKEKIKEIINSLEPSGLTDGVAGLKSAYEVAFRNFIENGNNQLILATDGEFTGSQQSTDDIVKDIKQSAASGVIMSIVGFGEDATSVSNLKKMSKNGNGQYIQINRDMDNTQLLIDEIKINSKY